MSIPAAPFFDRMFCYLERKSQMFFLIGKKITNTGLID